MRIWGRLSVRPRRREVSLLLTGIKQTRWNEGVSGAGAGGRGWPGALLRTQSLPSPRACFRLSSTPASCHPHPRCRPQEAIKSSPASRQCPQQPPKEGLGTCLPPWAASGGRWFLSLILLEQDHPGKLVLFEKRLHEKAQGAQPPPSLLQNLRLLTSFQPIALHLDLPVLTGLGALRGHVAPWLSALDWGEVLKAEQVGPQTSRTPIRVAPFLLCIWTFHFRFLPKTLTCPLV